jgi:hypothetical protein
MRSFFLKRALPFLLVFLSFGIVLAPQRVLAQATQAPIRAPMQQGIGAQDRSVGDFISGLWETATGDGVLSENARIASGAANEVAADPIGAVRSEILNVPTGGSITDALTARLIGFIAFMMGLIVSFLGKIILLLVNVLLGFLSYNGFADAPPVIVGWRIVRDLANMFFIVVLIVASYATILGWRTNDLHVKKVLPNVLLYAVLVNFSKTIVALMIDASQIVMLTFVNAFAAIGAGNFTNALHLPLISDTARAASSTAAAAVAANGAGQVILDVILASALQIFLLVVAIGVMLMMVVFVVARIVGLWMLLIFSPMPFLAGALPDTFKKALGKQASEFWGTLSGLLTGGPIMAFWLWLTFATLSAQGADERLGLFQNTQAADLGTLFNGVQSGASLFINAIGNAQGLGSYLIAVAMMMMGLEAAMSASSAVGSTAGGWMKAIGKKTQDYAQRAALFAAGGGLVAGAGAIAGAVDSRYDLRGRAAAAARNWIPLAGQSKWLKEQQYLNRNEWLKDRKQISELAEAGLWREGEKQGAFRRAVSKAFLTGDRGAELAQVDHLTKTGLDEKAYDDKLKPGKDALKDKIKGKTNDAVVAKRVSDRIGKAQSAQMRINDLERAKTLLKGSEQFKKDESQKIDDAIKKIRKENPHLITDNPEERNKQMREARQNWSSLDADAKANFEVLKNVSDAGAFKETTDASGKKSISIGDRNAIEQTRKRLQGKDRTNFDSMVKFIEESSFTDAAGRTVAGIDASRLQNLSVEQDAQDRARVFEVDVNSKGEVEGGDFRQSTQRQAAQTNVRTNLSATSAGTWSPVTDTSGLDGRRGVTSTAAQQSLDQAASVIGVAETINNVGYGAPPAEAAALRQAATNHFASSIQRDGSSAAANLTQAQPVYERDANGYIRRDPTTNAPIEKLDANGQVVQASRLQRYQDPSVSQVEKDEIRAQYQRDVSRIMPVLDGIEDLSQDQQINIMGAMGQGNVGQLLNVPDTMLNEEQRQSVNNLRNVARRTAGVADQWFAEQNATPAGTARLQNFAAIDQLPEPQRAAALHASGLTAQQYQQYRDYTGVRMASTQLRGNSRGGSSGRRNRGAGAGAGGGGRARGGAGGRAGGGGTP